VVLSPQKTGLINGHGLISYRKLVVLISWAGLGSENRQRRFKVGFVLILTWFQPGGHSGRDDRPNRFNGLASLI
jgi:hypothetical protein